MTTKKIQWCTTHESPVFVEDDDPYDFWRCELSNRTGVRSTCVVEEATVTWPSP